MTGNGKRWLTAASVLASAALLIGAGARFSTADEPKAADLADLRDAVTAASKRGDNVDEIAKSLNALDKMLTKGWKQEKGKTDPPAELMALRTAVEAAARKGENVDDIRTQLDAVEMKLLGRVLVAPKAVAPPLGKLPPAQPERLFNRFPNDFPGFPQRVFPPQGGFGGFGGLDNEALKKAQELQRKALEMMLKDPNDPEGAKMAQEAVEMMLKGLADGGGGIIAPEMVMPELGGFARPAERFRLGIRMEKVPAILIDQMNLEAGRGIAITDVIAGSAAEKAGFKPNDILVEFAGKPVSDQPEALNRQIAAAKAGEKVDAVVLRKGKKVEVKGIELPAADREVPRAARRFPQPRFEPRPIPLPVRPNAVPDLVPGLGQGNGASTAIINGHFTTRSVRDGATYTLQGTIENGTAKLDKATIEADGKVTRAESLEKVPAEYRATVEKLLKTVGVKKEYPLRPKVKD